MERSSKKHNYLKTIIIIIFIFILVSCFLLIFKNYKQDLYNDYFIFSFLNNKNITSDENKENTYQYIFDVSYKNTYLKNINLLDSIDSNTIKNGKIAPGVSGEFQIIINSNIKSYYQIKFEDKYQKPLNLKFKIKEKEYNNLEEMQNDLTGIVQKDYSQEIRVNWSWDYMTKNDLSDIQDTNDGMNIEKYNFNIYVVGQEV